MSLAWLFEVSVFFDYLKLWDANRGSEEEFQFLTSQIPSPSDDALTSPAEAIAHELVNEVWASEIKRKETIESKANVLIAASVTALSAVIFLAGNSKPQNVFSKTQNVAIDCLFSVAALSWLAAGVFAFATTRVTGLHAHCVELTEAWKSLEKTDLERARSKYLHLCCVANVAKLRQKGNLLSVAQRHFIEAFIVLGITVPLFIIFRIYQLNKSFLGLCTHPLIIFILEIICFVVMEILVIACFEWPYKNAEPIKAISKALAGWLFKLRGR